MLLHSVFVLSLLGLAGPVRAQQREVPLAPAPPGTLRITVTLVQVDVTVTDGKGRHINDLRPEDFEIFQNGEPQVVTHFSYVPDAPPPPRREPLSKNPIDRLPLAPAPVTASQVRRTVALVVDDLTMDWESLVRTRLSLHKYVEQQMQPGDLVAIVRTGGGVTYLEQFTTDRRMLLENIDSLKWRYNGRIGVLPVAPLGVSREATPERPEILDEGSRVAALGAIGTMESLIRGMKRMPGRKSVVFISRGMRMWDDVQTAVDRLTDLANRSAVSLYAVNPEGLEADHRISAASNDIPDLTGPMFPDDEYDRNQALETLVRRTGGLLFFNDNDIPGAIRRAADDQLGYYLLGYSPREGTFDDNQPSAKFHRIQVRVRRPGLVVRWKSGFSGVPDSIVDQQAIPKTREEQIADALMSPFIAAGLKVRATATYLHDPDLGSGVSVMLHFAGKELELKKTDAGMWTGGVDAVFAAYKGGSKPSILQNLRRYPIELDEEGYRTAVRDGFLLPTVWIPVKEPGTFILRTVVRDDKSGRLGSASQVLQVPDTRKGQFALSGIRMRLYPPEMMDSLKKIPPGARQKNEGHWAAGNPAVRQFKPGHTMVHVCTIVNPKAKPKEVPNVTTQVRVFRNGEMLFSGEPAPLTAEHRYKDDRHYGVVNALYLGNRMPPGEYLLQMIAVDRKQKKKNQAVAQWADFEIVPESKPPSAPMLQ